MLHSANYPIAATATSALTTRSLLLLLETTKKRKYLIPQYGHISPESSTGIFSHSTYWWLNRFFIGGFRGNLSLDSLYPLDEELSSKSTVSRHHQQWKNNEEKCTRRLTLFCNVIYDLKWTVAAAVIPRLCLIGFKFAQPFLINDLIGYVSKNGSSELSGVKYGYLGATVLIYVGIARQAVRIITMTRGSLVTMIYAKILRQASDPRQEASSTTLMSTDIDRIATGLLNFHELWASPVEIMIALVLLGRYIGYPSVAALGVALVSVLGCSYLAPQARQMQKAWVHAVQERVNFTSVILKEMRQIKMFGVESDMAFKIHSLRQLELHRSRPFRSMVVAVNVLGAMSTAIAPALTIAVYAATQLDLGVETPNTDIAFTSLSLISLLTEPVVLLSASLTKFTSAIGCFDRVQEFICKESRVNKDPFTNEYLAPESFSGMELQLASTQSKAFVCMTDCCFSLGLDTPAILRGITLKIHRASFSAVTGPIGSGKSSLLKAILGEMHRTEGIFSLGSVKTAYCQQSPWIFNGTLRANIIGESPLDEEWLKEVVYVCALEADSTTLSHGLGTVAGSSGAQLSGGQKQRVALARAIYARPSLLVFDDIFGALDAVTSRSIFERLLGRTSLTRRLSIATILVTTAESKEKTGETCESETLPNISRGDGDVSLYTYYINSFGWWVLGLTLLFAALHVFCIAFPQVILGWWCGSVPPKNYLYLGSYVGVSSIAIIAIGAYIGFSQDMSLLDMQLPVAFAITLQTLLTCIAQGALIATGSGYMAAAIPFCILAVWIVQAFYLRTSRQIRLLDLEAKAPLYAHFLETTEGLITVRAFRWQRQFADRNTDLLNTSQKPFYTMYSIQQWLHVVLDLLIAGIATVLVALAVFVTKQSTSGAVGVALLNLLTFNSTLTFLITNWTELETSLGAIARVKQFVNDPQLQPIARREIYCPEGWPWEGRMEFRRVSASYGEHGSVPVVRDISFTLQGGQKLGICGRTGSGKSSLLACILSLATITSGEIYIDNIDISTIPKEKLHSALVPISQIPLLLPGSVRENISLGIASAIDDSEMISALEGVGLWNQIQEHGGLSANIDSTHLSDGQKQVFCIARAILSPGIIVIMDEPTGGFDEHTAKLTIELLHERLKGRTIISIAHQVNTLMDFDLIMVMNDGTISEMGAPQELLGERGMFWDFFREKVT
ncbi:ABC transporter integral membrane type 1 [Penicillium robsamsonii]|uniref:ABC transporter integral membrane type 1 n=1 Tax=Penicillium robsamsonii TaxID=1792511 RepID=UPI002549A8E6|nr:ABC transporter integral membrane type 1 [Penicillium robsamsonii]KAJ5812743.1 ABC transporter integral membrane type 1 [Penicillium robsamsonii]